MMNKLVVNKKIFLTTLVALFRRSSILESFLVYILSNSFEFKFKCGAIAFAYEYLNEPEFRIANLNQYKIYVNIVEHDGNLLYFFRKNPEQFSSHIVKELLNKSDICIDIGANMGSYSFLMASLVGKTGKVFCFEPNPNLYEMLLKSIECNDYSQVYAEKFALSSSSGQTLKFFVSTNPNNSGTSSLIDHGVYIDQDKFIEVETITLDDYFKTNEIYLCKLVKIDVERAEFEVVKGMVKSLEVQAIDYIILEQYFGSDSQKLLDLYGYSCWFINETNKMLTNIEDLNERTFGNFLFVKATCLNEFKNKCANLLENLS